jgi:HflK protein
VAYAATGVYAIRPSEVGIVRRFGRASATVPPGLHIRLPWPFTSLDRLRPGMVRRIEIGFRADGIGDVAALAAYEWNIQHRGGRYRMIPAESLMTCGDQSFLEINAALHYRVSDPHRYLFGAAEPDRVLRALAENALREVIARTPLTEILTDRRAQVQTAALESVAKGIEAYNLGVDVLSLNLQDVHPPLNVVAAFREVVDALEEKDAAVNRAEAYRNEQVPIARGEGQRLRLRAQADADTTLALAEGEAQAFTERVRGRNAVPGAADATDFELYVSALESVLPKLKLTVMSPTVRGRRGLVLVGANALPRPPATQAALADDTGATGTGADARE